MLEANTMPRYPQTVIKFSKVGNKISLNIHLTFKPSDAILVCAALLLIGALLVLGEHIDTVYLRTELIKLLMKVLGLATIWLYRRS